MELRVCLGKLGTDLIQNCKYANFVGDDLKNNDIFDLNSTRNRDNCLEPYVLLKKFISASGVEINTPDFKQENKVLFELHMDVQKEVDRQTPCYVILYETSQIRPINQSLELLARYRHIFTWRDDWVNGEQYVKLNLPNKIIINDSRGWDARDKLCCMIAGNKSLRYKSPLDLYSQRIKTIRWFEQHAPQDFDLYGQGWDKPAALSGLLGKVINKIQRYIPNLSGRVFFPSYRGKVVSKLETLQKYRFCICYENVRDLPGYITEKIFDSFFAGCIPVYWGASNITTYIPQDCFIDRRNFSNHEELYHFMVSMAEPEFIAYQIRIAAFLRSDKAKPFSAETFAETIVNTIVRDLGIKI